MVSGFRPLESKKGLVFKSSKCICRCLYRSPARGGVENLGCQFVYESLLEDLAVTCHAQARYFRVSQCSTARSMSDSQLLEAFGSLGALGGFRISAFAASVSKP